MHRLLSLVSGLTVLFLMGCGGSTSAVTPTTDPAELARESAVVEASDLAVTDFTADSAVGSMLAFKQDRPGFADWDACTDITGDRQTGGTITYNDCQTPFGTLAGFITWTNGDGSRTTSRDLTFTRTADGSVRQVTGLATWAYTDLGEGSHQIQRTGETETTNGTRRVVSESDLSWTWTRLPDVIERSYPVGTVMTTIYNGTEIVYEVTLTFDGTATVKALVNGIEYSYRIDQRAPRQPRPHRLTPRSAGPQRR